MAAFTSITDLQNWLQESSLDTATATLAVDVASGMIRTYCGWSVSQETVTVVLDGPGQRSLWLPTLRLTDVSSVEVAGVPLTQGTDYDWTSYGKLVRNGRWPNTARSVEVTFTHGYNPVPDVVKGVCLMLAARGYRNPQALKARSEAMGPFNESVTYDAGIGLSSIELEQLGPFKMEFVG